MFYDCSKMWEFLKNTVDDLGRVTDFVQNNADTVKQLLKEPPNISTYVTYRSVFHFGLVNRNRSYIPAAGYMVLW